MPKYQLTSVPRRAQFEEKLALSLLLEMSKTTILSTISKVILDFIANDEAAFFPVIEMHAALLWGASTQKNENIDYIQKFSSYLTSLTLCSKKSQPSKTDIASIITLFDTYKIFFEHILLETIKNNLHLACLLQKQHYRREFLRRPWLFHECARDRQLLPNPEPTKHFGISEIEPTNWRYNFFPTPILHGKEIYQCTQQTLFTKICHEHDIPVVTGPSGTMSFYLSGLSFLMPLSNSDLRDFINITAAAMIAAGHHSYYEVVVIAEHLGIFSGVNEFPAPDGANSPDSSLFNTTRINLDNIYDSCLPQFFRSNSPHYQDLKYNYPEYFDHDHKIPYRVHSHDTINMLLEYFLNSTNSELSQHIFNLLCRLTLKSNGIEIDTMKWANDLQEGISLKRLIPDAESAEDYALTCCYVYSSLTP